MDNYAEEILASRKAAEKIATPMYDPEQAMWNPNKKDKPAPVPLTPEQKRTKALADIQRRLMEPDIENNKRNPRGGWREAEKRWYPHDSAEGGAQTVGYGVKLSNGTKWAELAKQQGYLTDQQAEAAVKDMSAQYYDAAKRVFDERYGAGSWDKLNFKQQSILTDYQYNVGKGGLKRFEKLMDAAYAGDVDGMLRESHRKQNEYRNASIARDIDSLRTAYPVSPIK